MSFWSGDIKKNCRSFGFWLKIKNFSMRYLFLLHFFHCIFLDKFCYLSCYIMNETSAAHVYAVFLEYHQCCQLSQALGAQRVLGSKGCQHKKSLKKGMCCASGLKYRNSVCYGVDKKLYVKHIECVIITIFIMGI